VASPAKVPDHGAGRASQPVPAPKQERPAAAGPTAKTAVVDVGGDASPAQEPEKPSTRKGWWSRITE